MGTVTVYMPDKIHFFFYQRAAENQISVPKLCQEILYEWMRTQSGVSDKAIKERLEYIDEQIALKPGIKLKNKLLTELNDWKTKAQRETTKQDIQQRIDKLRKNDKDQNTFKDETTEDIQKDVKDLKEKWTAEQEIKEFHDSGGRRP